MYPFQRRAREPCWGFIFFLSSHFKAWQVSTQTRPRTTRSQETRTMTTIWKKLFRWLGTGVGALIIPTSGCLGLRTPLLHISLLPGRRILINRSRLWNSGLSYVLWYSWTCITAIWRRQILHRCIFSVSSISAKRSRNHLESFQPGYWKSHGQTFTITPFSLLI